MRNGPLTVTAVASILVSLAGGSAAQSAPPDFPLAILCFVEKTQTWNVGYLREVGEDGSAIYSPLNGGLSVTVSADGLVVPPSDRPAVVDCHGKTWMSSVLPVAWRSSSPRNSTSAPAYPSTRSRGGGRRAAFDLPRMRFGVAFDLSLETSVRARRGGRV